MTGNFWEAQRRARKKTKVYLFFFVTIALGMAILLEVALHSFSGPEYETQFPLLATVFLALTLGVAAFQYSMFRRYGGRYVAESVGGKLITLSTANEKELQLINIVQEIAIASSLPTPPVYLLDAKQINAFAAGLTKDNAAIAITKGALDTLNREELQGVVAHEFGHIYNGDMKISLTLAAMVMGFFFVLYMALRMLQFSSLSGRRQGNGQKGANPILLAALLLMGAGSISWFAGSILKAMVSREREYLADACAVQFTRNPNGIANALRKIAKEHHKDMPAQAMAYSHLYLDNHLGINALFATHPPIEKRIKAILGLQYLPEEWKKDI